MKIALINRTVAFAMLLIVILPAMGSAVEENEEHSDMWLEVKLETTYLFNTHINPFEIDADVKDGVAYLKGTVEEPIDKDLAEEIALSIQGIKSVENEITIEPGIREKLRKVRSEDESRSFSEKVSDATITAQVKSKLLWNRHTDGLEINVTTNNGVVSLKGNADTSAAKDLAERLALNTSGVREVKNELTVKAKDKSQLGKVDLDKAAESAGSAAKKVGDDISDGWISTKVRSMLVFSSDVNSSRIDVTTDDGRVTLHGTALSSYQKERAEEIAKDIRGVKSVKNDISIIGRAITKS